MTNRNLDQLWHYHNATKHSYESVRRNAHYLDWANYPFPFKLYPELKPIPLPREWSRTEGSALAAVADSLTIPNSESISHSQTTSSAPVDLKTLAAILYHSAGITRRRSSPAGASYFR